MNGRSSLFIFFRFISRSCVWEKSSSADLAKKLKLESNVKVPVEEDTHKLANYVCGSNLFIEGGEDIKLKPDSEYPEWLWKIRSPPPLSELDPNTKTYWNRIRKIREKEEERLKALLGNAKVHKKSPKPNRTEAKAYLTDSSSSAPLCSK